MPRYLGIPLNPQYGMKFSVEDLKRFHAGWLGVDYDAWKDSPGGQTWNTTEHGAAVQRYIVAGLRSIFPNATFEDET